VATTAEATASRSVERITQGAIRALARHGLRKLTMTDICDEAGVSRGTLYRYFKDKDQVLEAVGHQVESTLKVAVDNAIAADPEPAHRLQVVLRAVLDYQQLHPETVELVRVEPTFALDFLTRRLPVFVDILTDALEPVLTGAPPVRSRKMTRQQLAEMFLRFVISAIVIPPDDGIAMADRVAGMWKSLTAASAAGQHAAPARRRAARAS
jgi:AcrR family transcriptional regulator